MTQFTREDVPKLSKSRFMAGLQCQKRLYLDCLHGELAEGTPLLEDPTGDRHLASVMLATITEKGHNCWHLAGLNEWLAVEVCNMEAQIMETLDEFVKRFSTSVGCFYHRNPSRHAYSLKRYNDTRRGHMGVFGWVSERVAKNRFVISTYQGLVDPQSAANADKTRLGAHYKSKEDDPEGEATGLSYYVERGSTGTDYRKAVIALQLACKSKL